MSGSGQADPGDRELELARLRAEAAKSQAETAKSQAEAAKTRSRGAIAVARTRQWPWVSVPAGMSVVALALAGEQTAVSLDFFSNVSVTIGISLLLPAGGVKIFMDWREIRRLRERCDSLERENEQLRRQIDPNTPSPEEQQGN